MSLVDGNSKHQEVARTGISEEALFDASRRLSFDDEGRGGSPELIAVYVKARDLAQTLGHSTIEIPHLLLGFTLTPDGINRLVGANIDAPVVRRNCWMALAVHPSQPDGRSAITFSTDLRAINAIASKLAKKNDSIARMVQTSHVLEALRDESFKDTVVPLMAATRPAPTPEEIRLNVETFKHYLEESLPVIGGKVDLIEQRIAALARELSGSIGAVAGAPPEPPSIRSIIAEARESLQENSGKLEKKLRNIKAIAIYAVVFSGINIAIILALAMALYKR